jgi:signal transducing adaptor molecule
MQVRALYDFTPTGPGEIGFGAGDVINVTQSTASDWWDGDIKGATGAFPANYVEKI